jgi:hypothetical protein
MPRDVVVNPWAPDQPSEPMEPVGAATTPAPTPGRAPRRSPQTPPSPVPATRDRRGAGPSRPMSVPPRTSSPPPFRRAAWPAGVAESSRTGGGKFLKTSLPAGGMILKNHRSAPPLDYDGPGAWSPEHLLLAAVETCFLFTLRARQGLEDRVPRARSGERGHRGPSGGSYPVHGDRIAAHRATRRGPRSRALGPAEERADMPGVRVTVDPDSPGTGARDGRMNVRRAILPRPESSRVLGSAGLILMQLKLQLPT